MLTWIVCWVIRLVAFRFINVIFRGRARALFSFLREAYWISWSYYKRYSLSMLCLRNAPESTVGNELARVLEMLAEVVVLMCIERDLNFQSAFTISLKLIIDLAVKHTQKWIRTKIMALLAPNKLTTTEFTLEQSRTCMPSGRFIHQWALPDLQPTCSQH